MRTQTGLFLQSHCTKVQRLLLPRAFSLSVLAHKLSAAGCSSATSWVPYQPDQSGNQLCSHHLPPALADFAASDTSSALGRSRAAEADCVSQTNQLHVLFMSMTYHNGMGLNVIIRYQTKKWQIWLLQCATVIWRFPVSGSHTSALVTKQYHVTLTMSMDWESTIMLAKYHRLHPPKDLKPKKGQETSIKWKPIRLWHCSLWLCNLLMQNLQSTLVWIYFLQKYVARCYPSINQMEMQILCWCCDSNFDNNTTAKHNNINIIAAIAPHTTIITTGLG